MKLNYDNSREMCASHDMDLVNFDSASEATYYSGLQGDRWIGITDKVVEGSFWKYNGLRSPQGRFLTWIANEPSDAGRTLENCIAVSGRYHDFYCQLEVSAGCMRKKVPSICHRTAEISSGGEYVKTICSVDTVQSRSESRTTCENNGMKLVDSNEYLSDLFSIARSWYSDGGFIWVDSNVGCSLLAAPTPMGSASYNKVDNQVCYANFVSFCEYNSE